MVKTYDVLTTNPPYMGGKYMNPILTNFIKDNYKETKSDLFSAFMECSREHVNKNGQLGFITPYVWMFLSTYEQLRREIINSSSISSLIQLEYNAFPEACVPVCTFTIRNYNTDIKGEYIKLSEFRGSEKQEEYTLKAVKDNKVKYRYSVSSNTFTYIPGTPISYWTTHKVKELFKKQERLDKISPPRVGMMTGNNDLFLREWFEVDINNIDFNIDNIDDIYLSRCKWFLHNKGGEFRKWYGNNRYILNFKNKGEEILKLNRKWYGNNRYILNFKNKGEEILKLNPKLSFSNNQYYFKESITWSEINSTYFGVRYIPKGFTFNIKGPSIFPKKDIEMYLLALLNTSVCDSILKSVNQTISINAGDVAKLPIIITENERMKRYIEDISFKSVQISKYDWDSFENSWEFDKHPIIKFRDSNNTIEYSFAKWYECTNKNFNSLKSNEEELNKIFIDIYGLEDEIPPEVEDKDITIRLADRERDIKSFISYAVGCMLGRYSLDQEGLVYAGGEVEDKDITIRLADRERDIKSFISYAVGCMLGRYSLDQEGLVYAGGEFDSSKYTTFNRERDIKSFISYAVGCMLGRYSLDQEGLVYAGGEFDSSKYTTFKADEDNIIPILDESYLEDDIVSRFIEFVKVTFGEETLKENLEYIANTLDEKTGKLNPKDTIRKYFLTEFYKDHIQTCRYSLDQEGLVYAGGEFDSSKYTTFKADKDNIIPILDENYFEDDIVSRFIEFVKVTFGEETLKENLEYIASTLDEKSGKSNPKDTIRKYFLNEFYKDHVQTYKKRPIYWLVTSGKEKAFNALIYMHRYDKNTLSRIRTDYVHPLQNKLEVTKARYEEDLSFATKASEKKPINNKTKNIDKQIDELKKFEETLHDFADKQIEIDLDDGVLHNYAIFKGLLGKI